MLQIGKDIVTGIWDGITGMASWLGEQISGFVNGIVEGFKAAFDSHSPSRRMRDEVGKTIPQGVAVGIEADTSKVRTAMEQLIGQGYQAVMGAQGLAASAQRSLRPALAAVSYTHLQTNTAARISRLRNGPGLPTGQTRTWTP